MLTSIASSSRPAGSLHVRANYMRSLGRSSAALVRSLNQTRAYRNGPAGFSLDPESSHETTRRQHNRKMKLEAKNRKLAWDKHPDTMPVCKIEKRMASHYQRAQKPEALNQDASSSAASWAGDNIEAVERGALENLLFGHTSAMAPETSQLRPVGLPRGTLTRTTKQAAATATGSSILQSNVEPDYVIDPITNRKVLKASIKTPLTGQPSGPIFDSDMPATPEELRRYRQVKIDSLTSDNGILGTSPVLQSEDYVKNHMLPKNKVTVQTTSQSKYSSVFWHWGSGVKFAGEEALAEVKTRAVKQEVDDISSSLAVDPEPIKVEPVAETPAQEGEISQYEDLDKYKPIMDKRAPVSEDPSAEYEDLDKYKPVMEKRMPVPEDPAAEYEDLGQYNPVMEKVAPEVQDPSAEYKDLDKYEPIKYNEPDGKPETFTSQEAYTDLPQYNAAMFNEPDGKPLDYVEAAYDPAELAQYGAFLYNEPDGKPPTAVDQVEYQDLNLYSKAVMYQEPDGKPASAAHETKPYDDLDQYGPVWHLEPDGKAIFQATPSPEADVLDEYTAVRYHEPDGKQASSPESYTDLAQYGALRYNEPDGKAPQSADAAAEGLAEFDLAQRLNGLGLYKEPSAEEQAAAELENLRASDVRAAAAVRAQSGMPDGSLGAGASSLGSGDAGLSNSNAPPPVSSPPRDLMESQLTGPERMRAVLDPFSRTPQGLEVSYAEECAGATTWPTYVRTYGSLAAGPHQPAREELTAAAAEVQRPTVYRILAYDTTTQTIQVAETTSTVPDGASSLPPTEALLRLSQPSKFFSHFSQLQEEGFEIVSGRGDVLVFRKMREPVTEVTSGSSYAAAASAPAINPIDMTGAEPFTWEPASAQFASPTGYVRYEPEPLDDCRPPPPPRRSAGSRRSAADASPYSGAKAADEPAKRPRLAKRMVIGATWVAGVSYGLGVVGEYFKSGGADGKGPSSRF